MANGKFSEMLDARLLEAAWHRFEAARAMAHAREKLNTATEHYNVLAHQHQKTAQDYEALERDIARGVRMGARVVA